MDKTVKSVIELLRTESSVDQVHNSKTFGISNFKGKIFLCYVVYQRYVITKRTSSFDIGMKNLQD